MKSKIFFIVSLVLFVISTSQARTFRQSVGQGKFAFDVSFEKYEINNKLVKSNSVVPSTWDRTYRAPVTRKVVMPRLAYGVCKHMDVFAGIGYCSETWNARRRDNDYRYTEQAGRDAIYEIGVKGTALEFMDDRLYLAYLVKFGYLRTGNHYSGPPSPGGSRVTWKQYDIDLELGYRLREWKLTPYVGIKYLDVEAKQVLDANRNEYENTNNVTCFVGVNKEFNENVSLDIEGNFGGKRGFGIGLRYAF